MINEYYGASTTPTSDYLAHYGVRGMKWGIRRAVASGNPDKLKKQYSKAVKKLAKLSLKANNTVNEGKYQKWRAQARKNAITGATGAAVGATIGSGIGIARAGRTYGLGLKDTIGVLKKSSQGRQALGAIGASIPAYAVAGGVGSYLGARARASIYKRRQNEDVRAKNLAKRDQWRKDMESAFKGTRYGGQQQKQFHKEISRLSETKNPKGYINNQKKKAEIELKRYQNNKKRR